MQSEPATVDNGEDPRRGEYQQVVKALRRLTPDKQSRVFEDWPGISGETPEGLKVTARTTKELRRFTKQKDEGMLSWIRSFQADDVFYDIGANVGGVSLTVAGVHEGRIPIVAIEPSFGSFESLARNLSLNGLLSSAIPLQVALLDETGLQPLHYRSTAAGTSLHAVGRPVDHMGEEFVPVEVQRIPTYKLDDLIEMLRLPAPTVVKIDVDGYEEPVLRGAVRTLSAATIRELNVEIVDHDGAGTRVEAVTGLLADFGYELAQSFRHGGEDGYVADYLFRRAASARPQGTAGNGEVEAAEAAPRAVVDDGTVAAGFAAVRDPESAGSAEGAAAAKLAAELKERNAALKKRNSELKVQNAELKARNTTLKKRETTVKSDNAELHRKVKALAGELGDVRRSYHLSGAAKKVDLRRLPGFSEIAREIIEDGRTGMNYDRLYALWQAVRSAPSGLPMVEVGSYKGGSARFIGETLRREGRSALLYVCDTFAGHPRTDAVIDQRHHGAGKFEDTSAEAVADYLGPDANVDIVVGDIIETSDRLAALTFGFVHLDVDVHEATAFCLRFFGPRLARDGVMLVDDYGVVTCPGVQKAVDEFVLGADGFRLIHLLSGQALLFRVA